MDPINSKPQIKVPKIIDLDGESFEEISPKAADEQSHRQLFAFDDPAPVEIESVPPPAILVFSEALLKQSVSDAITIAKNNGMDLNTLSKDKARILIHTSTVILKQKLESPNESLTNIKPPEIVKASTDDKDSDKTEVIPFNEFVLSLNGALGISKNEGVDLANLSLKKAIKILNKTFSIIEKKLKSRTKLKSEPIAYPASNIQRARIGLDNKEEKLE